jgi:2-polyprenyl-6-methoxyphenol hydroxylase-like FAD-dependent oxidoreductase
MRCWSFCQSRSPSKRDRRSKHGFHLWSLGVVWLLQCSAPGEAASRLVVKLAPESNSVDPEEVHKQLLDRHGSWKDPVIQEIIAAMSTDRIYPLWTTPELPYWGRDRALILGDAAHTLQANSGQGASQALEDSVAFTLLLASYLTKGKSDQGAIDLATRGLYKIRNPDVQTIKSQARNLFIMEKRFNNVIVEYALYCFIFLWTRFPVLSK